MAIKLTEVKASPFCNNHGGLSLQKGSDGKMYLEMQEMFEADHFGPLTSEQIAAFHTLCTVEEI